MTAKLQLRLIAFILLTDLSVGYLTVAMASWQVDLTTERLSKYLVPQITGAGCVVSRGF